MVINSSSLLVSGHLRMDFSDQGNFTMPGRWTRELKDWSQIFYQFALGAAGLKVLSDL